MQTIIDYQDRSYTTRLRAVKQLAKRFPGVVFPRGSKDRELGIWAGIMMQTRWQKDSGRDKLPIWYLVNQSLTLAPFALYQEYLANPDEPYEKSLYVKYNPTRSPSHAPLTQIHVCRAWKQLFQIHDKAVLYQKSPSLFRKTQGSLLLFFVLQRKLWNAHASSMRHALWQNLPALRTVSLPDAELRFWRGWIGFVLISAKLAPPTTEFFLNPFLQYAMPPQSPLGSKVYGLREQPFLRKILLRVLMSNPGIAENSFRVKIKKNMRSPLRWRVSL